MRVVIWLSSKKDVHKLYFSTNITMLGKDVIKIYRIRFQIEFNFHDAIQHAGLCISQSRNIEKRNFNFNTSLLTINLVKVQSEKGLYHGFEQNDEAQCFSARKIYCRVRYQAEQKLK